MTVSVSDALRSARTQFLIDLSEKNGGKVTPDQLLQAVGNNKKLLLNVLWNARRSNYVTVDQFRDGKKIAYWFITVVGDKPNVIGTLFVSKTVATKKAAKSATKTEKSKAVKSAAKSAKKTVKTKTPEQIKAENLKKMKKVTAKMNASKKKTKKVIDYVERELGSTGEISSMYSIDNQWDSIDGLNVKNLIAN